LCPLSEGISSKWCGEVRDNSSRFTKIIHLFVGDFELVTFADSKEKGKHEKCTMAPLQICSAWIDLC